MARDELTPLRSAYTALVKAGSGSLQAAYSFGQVIDALSTMYTLSVMAEEIGRSVSTLSRYLRFYRQFPTIQAALDLAVNLGTWDIGLLCAPEAPALGRISYGYQCNMCGSFDTVRKPKPEDEAARETVPAVKFSR